MVPENELPDFDAQWNFGNPAASEQTFRSILAEQMAAPLDYRLALRTQIARTLGLQRKFDEAHALLDEVERELSNGGVARIRYLLERGRVLNSSSRALEARPLFMQAMELARAQAQDRLAVDAAHMVAITLKGQEALAANLEALKMAEASSQEGARKWKGSLYNNIGWSYHDLGDYHQALTLFQKGVEFRRLQGEPVALRIALWTVARTIRSLGRFEDALQQQLDIQQAYPGEHPFVEEEIGECLLALGRADEARAHFAKAYASLKDEPGLTPERVLRLKELAGYGSRPQTLSAP
jgi:tetratricopeptide (TPR) repeat protein